MDNLQISKILHGMMSAFREGVGETPYPKWEELDDATKELYNGAIKLIQENMFVQTLPEDIHEYWFQWAKIHKPTHASLIPYEELSDTEKVKDMLIISVIENLLFLQKSVE